MSRGKLICFYGVLEMQVDGKICAFPFHYVHYARRFDGAALKRDRAEFIRQLALQGKSVKVFNVSDIGNTEAVKRYELSKFSYN